MSKISPRYLEATVSWKNSTLPCVLSVTAKTSHNSIYGFKP
jgi:hypothetical protein